MANSDSEPQPPKRAAEDLADHPPKRRRIPIACNACRNRKSRVQSPRKTLLHGKRMLIVIFPSATGLSPRVVCAARTAMNAFT